MASKGIARIVSPLRLNLITIVKIKEIKVIGLIVGINFSLCCLGPKLLQQLE